VLQQTLADLPRRVPAARWGACVREADTGEVLAAHDADAAMRTASVGKLLLLVEVARRCADGSLSPGEPLSRSAVAAVADSGLWQHLRIDRLPVADCAALVGAVSDNLATNVLLHRVGLPSVDRTATELGLSTTRLHDDVRDVRGPDHPPTLSTGTAHELTDLLARLRVGRVHDARASGQVLDWLAPGTDLSMVAAAFGLDPLAHVPPDRGVRLWNKTGTDIGVRADVGVLEGSRRAIAYAVLAEWDDGRDDVRDDVLGAMRGVGTDLLRAVR
jgi:beta-lactamase class A